MHDAADKLALALIVGGATLAFLLLIIGYRHDTARRRRLRGRAADFEGVLDGVRSGAGRKVGRSSRRSHGRTGPGPKRQGRAGSSDAGVFPSYIFAADGGGAHCSSDGGACDGGGGS